MPIPLAALATTLEVLGSIGPSIASWAKNRKEKKQSLEERLEHAESLLEELSKGFSGLETSLAAIQQALLTAQAEREKLATRTKRLSIVTGLSLCTAVGAILLALMLHR